MSASTYQRRLLLQLLNSRQRSNGAATQGFTLIELLVVIVILGVLGGVGYGSYVNQLGRANENTARVAVTAAAKNCAAILAAGDPISTFSSGVDGTRVQFSGSCSAGARTFTVVAGEGTNSRSAIAGINATGAVIPGAAGV